MNSSSRANERLASNGQGSSEPSGAATAPTADQIEGWLEVAINQLDGDSVGWTGKAAVIVANGLAAEMAEQREAAASGGSDASR